MLMRITAAAVLAVLAPASLHAAELEATSAIDAVTVYPDGATVARIVNMDLAKGDTTIVMRDFPPSLDPSSLRVEGEGTARVTVGAVDAQVPRPERPATHPELEKRLESLKDQRAILEDTIAAATTRKRFVERFATSVPLGMGEKGEARPLTEWRSAFAAVAEEMAAADVTLRDARLKQRDLDREIARVEGQLKANPARKMEVRIEVAAEDAGRAVFRVSYSVRGARWRPLYDARLDTGGRTRKPVLELVRRAEIMQNTGEDWTEVALAVSTLRTGKGGSAPRLQPLIVRYPAHVTASRMMRDEAAKAAAPAAAPPPASAGGLAEPRAAREREAVMETGGFQALFRIPGRVSVAASQGAKALRIATATVEPELMVLSAPALDDAAYLEAGFKQAEDAPLLPGAVAIYRDGVFVGRGLMPLAPKDEDVRLGFGVDEKFKVTRVALRRNQGSSGIISSSKTDEREYKITVRNGHEQPVKVRIEDQFPVSEISDVQIDILPSTTPPTHRDADDRRGVAAWEFDAKPGETREIKLGWRVRWPADKAVVYTPRSP
jgi:uncharacterized protein (TIGR02231 family)